MTRRNRFEREADRVLKQYGCFDLPIEATHVAEMLGVRVVPWFEALKVTAILYHPGGQPTIVYNRAHPSGRINCAVAHELGHWVLHNRHEHALRAPNFLARRGLTTNGVRQEMAEASQFAAALLMPRNLLDKETEKYDYIDEDDINTLAQRFCVTPVAMALRLTQLKLYLEDKQ